MARSRESFQDTDGAGPSGHGAKTRITEDDDVEGHSFSTMKSPSSKGE
ncbi:MAG: hypothetical protein ACHQ3P_09345 [Candidatus Limnocylindrales bacterium]